MNDLLMYGGRGADPRTVVVYGNCQVPYLARMLASLDDLNDDYRFVAVLNHAPPGQPLPASLLPPSLRPPALVLWQHEDRPDNPAAVALRAQLPPGCPGITFPSFIMGSLWPFECIEPRGGPEPGHPWGRFPFGDMIGLEIAKTGLQGSLAVAAYLDLSARKMPDLAVRLQRDVARMRNYDAQCDVQLADYVQANFRQQHLFWTSGHIARPALVELASRLAEVARPVLGGSASRVQGCLDASDAFEGIGEHQLPVHPLVAEVLGLTYCAPDRTWRWADQHWNFYEYIERYIAYDRDW